MPAPAIPILIIAKRVAVKPGLTEIVETAEILCRELIMGDLVRAECLKMIMGEMVLAQIIVRELFWQRAMASVPMGQPIACNAVTATSRSIA